MMKLPRLTIAALCVAFAVACGSNNTKTDGGSGGGTGTGGGTSGTGGGTTGMGGGTSGTGGGTTGMGGGTSGTGGGTSGTGGGMSGTGGGDGLITGCNVGAQDCPADAGICLISHQGNMATGTACYPGCDLVNSNCPMNQKCGYMIGAVSVRTCITAGTKTLGQSCGPMTDDCAAGLACVGGSCLKFCYSSQDCGTGSGCTAPVAPPGTSETPLTCAVSCNPLLQNCANATDACLPISQTDTLCTPAGTKNDGEACDPSMADCKKGSLCVGPQGQATCAKICNTDGGMPSCPGMSQCNGLGGIDFGACG